MEKFTFIILNYNSTEETLNCIDAINALNYLERYIIVVDNASKDQALFLEKVSRHCVNMKNIHILKSNENCGYACGNNIGIHFAKKVIKSDYICVMNPDAVIKSNNFIEKSIELYQKYNYAICGPKIVKDGVNCNPLGGYKESILFHVYHLLENYRIILVKKWRLGRFNFIKKLSPEYKNNKEMKELKTCVKNDDGTEMLLNKSMEKQLSGACLIFSPTFLKTFSGFCDKTFLYCEETILTAVCFSLGYKILYSSQLEVIHESGKSFENTICDSKERQIQISKIGAASVLAVIDVLLHKKNKMYLKNCLTPSIKEYSEYSIIETENKELFNR